jgi:lysophospholipase L1-like esterase
MLRPAAEVPSGGNWRQGESRLGEYKAEKRGTMAGLRQLARQSGGGDVAMALLAPLLLAQGRHAARRAPRLPDASGPAQGTNGDGDPVRRLLVIGESTAAGLGARTHTRALPGFMAAEISGRLGGTVHWSARGKGGATTRTVLAELVPAAPEAFDLTVLTVGINDLLGRRALQPWADDLLALIGALRGAAGRSRLIVSGMPPVHLAPGIPQPLRFVLGRRTRAMDRTIGQVSAASGAAYVPINVAAAGSGELFAPDGFHPSETGYREWARQLATAVPEELPGPA